MITEEKIKQLQADLPKREILNVADEEEQPSLFLDNGVEVCYRKAVAIIAAMKKNGKSQFCGLQIAACVSPEKQVLNNTLRCNVTDIKILYVDTEQPWRDCRRTLRRAMKSAGFGYDEPWNEHGIKCISVKDVEEADRMPIIELAVQEFRPDLLILDGLADLIPSINDERESKELLSWMDYMACNYDCAVEGVIHLNHGSSKMTGWTGTIAAKKYSDCFTVRKDKEHGLFIVEHEGRGESAPKLYFSICCPLNDKIGWWQPLDCSIIPELTREDAEELELRNLMDAAPLPCTNTQLTTWLMQAKRWTSKSPANKALRKCKEYGILSSYRCGQQSIWYMVSAPDAQEQELELSGD